MNEQLLRFLSRKPDIYEGSTSKLWDDEHISKGMLDAHLNPDLESATRKHEFVRKSADWIAQVAAPAQRPRLLDLGCGPGLYADLFAKKGFQVTGIDLSPRSISYAKDHTDQNNIYLCRNYLDIDDDQEFDVVTLIYCDFGVLSSEDRKTLLKKIFRALKEGGLLIFDVCSLNQYQGWEEKATWTYHCEGFWSAQPYACLYSFYRYDDCRTYNEQFVIIGKDNVRCFNIWNHAFTEAELRHDLAEVGFTDANLFDNVAGDAYTGTGNAICAVAQKR